VVYALHACWSGGRLHLWGEDAARKGAKAESGDAAAHPFAIEPPRLSELVRPRVGREGTPAAATMRLPSDENGPAPSSHLARALGDATDDSAPLRNFIVPTLAFEPVDAALVIDALIDRDGPDFGGESATRGPVLVGASIVFFEAALRLVRSLLSQQRFVPMLVQDVGGEVRGCWQPWLSDESASQQVGLLVRSMPGSIRSVVDVFEHQPWPILEDFLCRVVDAQCRLTLLREDFEDAIRERDPAQDAHVAWLSGLLGRGVQVPGTPASRQELSRKVRQWIGGLEERGASSAWRLLLRLNEPVDAGLNTTDADDPEWSVTFHLQSVDRPTLIIDAEDIWMLPGDSINIEGKRIEGPQELLLGELGRASRLFPRLEKALEDSEPKELPLSTRQAYEYLREVMPVLHEQGFGVAAPDWWDSPLARLGARLRLDSDPAESVLGGPTNNGAVPASSPSLGLGALVKYRWEIAIGDTTLTLNEFEKLAARKSPLVRINGRWVEIRPEDVQSAMRFIRDNPGGEMKLGEALRLAYASDLKQTGIPVVGMEATGWVQAMLSAEAAAEAMKVIEPPERFHGTLRPYQLRGVSWMAFLERLGFGICLADDMGLGKTIQLLALLALERQNAAKNGAVLKPTLLVVPMSVVGNWIHETRRFCPELKVLVHHGGERLAGQTLIDGARSSDMVVTTYSLANRDRETLESIDWGRIVLDEAQYIKNPVAKQTQAVRAIKADRRVALTGTPVENRLSELWSIMDFLNPGYLGTAGGFRTRFAVAIERYRDKAKAEQLKGLVRPFVLRRLKTDPTVVADLPEKLESREYCPLTSEQANLYESCVRRMLAEVEASEGIQRRGMVLSALIKLKQICNHPSLLLKDHASVANAVENASTAPPSPARSGKCIRLLEMLDELLAEGDQALIFTQFRQMGHLLSGMLRHHLNRDVLFLHGGTPQKMREQLVANFQKADGSHPILLVSLKAGGVGLNLTAANHVFHFDRWWNPAVENQATDRAYRIGQTRTVQVHKFVVRGTLEERIDQMIEAKTELAENIIGSGERWLTELDTEQLRDILTLRNDAIADEV